MSISVCIDCISVNRLVVHEDLPKLVRPVIRFRVVIYRFRFWIGELRVEFVGSLHVPFAETLSKLIPGNDSKRGYDSKLSDEKISRTEFFISNHDVAIRPAGFFWVLRLLKKKTPSFLVFHIFMSSLRLPSFSVKTQRRGQPDK